MFVSVCPCGVFPFSEFPRLDQSVGPPSDWACLHLHFSRILDKDINERERKLPVSDSGPRGIGERLSKRHQRCSRTWKLAAKVAFVERSFGGVIVRRNYSWISGARDAHNMELRQSQPSYELWIFGERFFVVLESGKTHSFSEFSIVEISKLWSSLLNYITGTCCGEV